MRWPCASAENCEEAGRANDIKKNDQTEGERARARENSIQAFVCASKNRAGNTRVVERGNARSIKNVYVPAFLDQLFDDLRSRRHDATVSVTLHTVFSPSVHAVRSPLYPHPAFRAYRLFGIALQRPAESLIECCFQHLRISPLQLQTRVVVGLLPLRSVALPLVIRCRYSLHAARQDSGVVALARVCAYDTHAQRSNVVTRVQSADGDRRAAEAVWANLPHGTSSPPRCT